MKRCSRCNRWLQLGAFTRHARRADGLQPFCQDCQRAAVRDHYAKNLDYYLAKARRRAAALRAPFRLLLSELKSLPCTDCGRSFATHAMDFDHVRGDKRFNLSAGGGFSKTRLLEEVAKCDLVCSNCHRLRTYARMLSQRNGKSDKS